MKRNSHILFVSFLLVFCLITLAVYIPKYIGEDIETRFREGVTSLSDNTQLAGKVVEYNRGWFDSDAKSLITIPMGDEEAWFYFTHKIIHGPRSSNLSYGKIHSELIAPEKYKKETQYYFGDESPLKITNILYFSGINEFVIRSPSYVGDMLEDENTSVAWQGITGRGSVNSDLNKIEATLDVPLFKFKEKNVIDTSYENLSLGISMHRATVDKPWYGDVAFIIGELDVYDRLEEDPKIQKVLIKDAKYELGIRHDTDLIQIIMRVGSNELVSANKTIKDIYLEASLNNINKDAYEVIDNIVRNANTKHHSEEYVQEVYNSAFEELLPQLLSKHPSLSLEKFRFSYDDSEFIGSAKLKYIGGQNLENFNPRYDIEVESNIRLDKKLYMEMARTQENELIQEYIKANEVVVGKDISTEKINQIIEDSVNDEFNTILNTGFIQIDDDDVISTNFSLKKGNLYINSKLANEEFGWDKTEQEPKNQEEKYMH